MSFIGFFLERTAEDRYAVISSTSGDAADSSEGGSDAATTTVVTAELPAGSAAGAGSDPTSTPSSGMTTFVVPADAIESSADGSDAIITFATTEAGEAPPIGGSEPDRLAIVNVGVDADRLGLEFGGRAPTETELRGREQIEAITGGGPAPGLITLDERTEVSGSGFSFPGSDAGREDLIRNRVFAEGAEIIVGEAPTAEEKPRILATLASEIRNGYPAKNVIFMKKFTSERGIAEKYTIQRKKLFEENNFIDVGVLQTDSIPIPSKYSNIADLLPQPRQNIFYFEDETISKDSVYVYRVVCKWDELSSSEVASRRLAQQAVDTFTSGTRGPTAGILFTIL